MKPDVKLPCRHRHGQPTSSKSSKDDLKERSIMVIWSVLVKPRMEQNVRHNVANRILIESRDCTVGRLCSSICCATDLE